MLLSTRERKNSSRQIQGSYHASFRQFSLVNQIFKSLQRIPHNLQFFVLISLKLALFKILREKSVCLMSRISWIHAEYAEPLKLSCLISHFFLKFSVSRFLWSLTLFYETLAKPSLIFIDTGMIFSDEKNCGVI